MFKELKTQEEKDRIVTLSLLHTPGMEPLPSAGVNLIQDFGRTTVVRHEDSEHFEGNHVVISGRGEDVQNYLKNVPIIILGVGSPIFEQFEFIKND